MACVRSLFARACVCLSVRVFFRLFLKNQDPALSRRACSRSSRSASKQQRTPRTRSTATPSRWGTDRFFLAFAAHNGSDSSTVVRHQQQLLLRVSSPQRCSRRDRASLRLLLRSAPRQDTQGSRCVSPANFFVSSVSAKNRHPHRYLVSTRTSVQPLLPSPAGGAGGLASLMLACT